MSKKEKNRNPTIFALSTMTHLIPKYHYKEDGTKVNENFNNRSYAKKAFKAYLKGKDHFMYNGVLYTVPKIKKKHLEEYLDSIEIENEDLENNSESNIESNDN